MLPVGARIVGGGDIFDTIQRGNIDQCAHIIQFDRSTLKQKGWGGFTPLHYAASQGNRAMTDLLLSSGADANTPCDTGLTPFHFACRNGNIHVMHQMLQHGADLSIVDHQGKTALHHAVTGGNVLSVQYLNETGMFRLRTPTSSRSPPCTWQRPQGTRTWSGTYCDTTDVRQMAQTSRG
ncbi:hypothetical protein AAFF_G00138760 [Aldrovandia affinis]|uniref:Uncharacterized protein n=1 Tax=Aldrovandia affinis TaxID=143900 RepID=A0AAD7X2L8_9TELE|nr:hypothetical protein AAFF_G00138760 [Aldrovandia affinis]